tara:strand:+ start:35 stop:160 length:126 start_codon:yes stop_codon:yes gene_type:complete
MNNFKKYVNAFVMFPAICFMTAVAIQEVKKTKAETTRKASR